MITESFKLLYGLAYQNTLNFSEYVTKHEGGLPSKKIKASDKTSDGAILSRLNMLSGYKSKLSIVCFDRPTNLRDDILKVCTLPSYIPMKLQRTREVWEIGSGTAKVVKIEELECQIQLNDGEKYQGGYEVSEFDINIFSENSYFSNINLTTYNEILNETILITNQGFNVYPQFKFTLSEDCSLIDLKLYEGYGFKYEYEFKTGDIIEVDNSDSELSMYVNNALIANVLTAGSMPFEILPGENVLYYQGGAGTLEIMYHETAL